MTIDYRPVHTYTMSNDVQYIEPKARVLERDGASAIRSTRTRQGPRWTMTTEFFRITRNPDVMGGRACIRGMRVTVGMILGNLGEGVMIEELLAAYPYLEREDVLEAIRCGAWLAAGRGSRLSAALGGAATRSP